MKIKVNGEQKDFEDGLAAAALLERLGIEAAGVALEINLDIIPRGERAKKVLKEGDEVEIVKFIGGG